MSKTIQNSKKAEDGLIIKESMLRDKIYIIRGQKVMLDYDLAGIYGYTTSAFNQQVKNNLEKFEGEDFMFRLTRDEVEYFLKPKNLTMTENNYRGQNNLKSKNLISSWGGVRFSPCAFTEQGIYMLMTVLRGPLAVKQSRALIRMFKAMKDYIIENQEQIDYKDNLRLAMKVADNTQDLEKMKAEMGRIDAEISGINRQ